MFDYSNLYGKIKGVYETHEAFACAMGMSRSALSMRLKNSVSWKTEEIVKACVLLGIPLEKAHLYFFCTKSLENQDCKEA